MMFTVFLPYLMAYLFAAVLLVFAWFWLFAGKTAEKIGKLHYPAYLGFVLMLVTAGRGGLGYKPVAIIDAFASGYTQQGNLILNGVFSISHSALKAEDASHQYFSEAEAQKLLFDRRQPLNPQYPFQQEFTDRQPPTHNLVLVLIESLSFKYVDSFAHRNYGVTPNLDRLAEEGLKFTNFFAAGQRSIEGIQATLTGLPPIIGLPTLGVGLLSNYSKLGEIANANGYTTICVESLKRRSFRMDAIAGSTGFTEFYGQEDMSIRLNYPDPTASKWGWDYETYMTAADRMEKVKKPFLTYIITSTTHTPYPPLPAYLVKYPHTANTESGFLNTLNYTDWSIGEFMKRVRQQPWFDQTIFIFTADHALAHHQGGGFIERFHIPLIVYAPKRFSPATITTVTSQIDLFPSIIDMLNLKGRFSSFGESFLLENPARFAMVREGSILGIISDKGFLRHSLNNRLESQPFIPATTQADFDQLENKLLAADQLIYAAVRENHWAE